MISYSSVQRHSWQPSCRKWLLDNPTFCTRTLRYVKQTGEPNFGFQEISATISLLTSRRLTLQIVNPLIIMCGSQLSERPTKLKAMITAAFSYSNKDNDGKACRRFLSRLEDVVENSDDFFGQKKSVVFYDILVNTLGLDKIMEAPRILV